jgi:hypothetical protein
MLRVLVLRGIEGEYTAALEGLEEMRRAMKLLQTTILILAAGLFLAGCGSPGEVRYVSRTGSAETLTLNRARTVKTKLMSTFHGVTIGSFTLKRDGATTSGTFVRDNDGIRFKSEDGRTQTVKPREDGSFDFAESTWAPVAVVKEKSLKAVVLASQPETAR